MPMSPRTQSMGMQGGVPSDQAKTLFDQGLSQMAYNVLINKLPNISPDVVTFKVLDSEPETGSGVGAFVVMRKGQTIYIPVVMAENSIKPLDILYYKDLNVFMPLSKEWLEELDKLSLGEMGQGVKPPDTLSSDVDIRNTVVPPSTGRYSYASDTSTKTASAIKQAFAVFDQARHQSEPKLAFLDFLSKAPNKVKTAAARLFETRPTLLKQAVWFYGETPLVEALSHRQEKTASAETSEDFYIADINTPAEEFRRVFGKTAGEAFGETRRTGFAAKDARRNKNRALQVQPYKELVEPKTAGAYRLWKLDGKPVLALIMSKPIDLFNGGGNRVQLRKTRRGPGNTMNEDPITNWYVGMTEDGELFEGRNLLAEPASLDSLEGSAVYKKAVTDESAAGPRVGQRGIFLQRGRAGFSATAPVKIESITNTDRTKRIGVSGPMGERVIVIDEESSSNRLMVPKDSQVIFMPRDYVWLPAKGELKSSELLINPRDIMKFATLGLLNEGAEKVAVSKIGGEESYLIGREPAYGFVPALRKLATAANIGVEDAEFALKKAAEDGKYSFWVIPENKYAGLVEKLDGTRAKKPAGFHGDEVSLPPSKLKDEPQEVNLRDNEKEKIPGKSLKTAGYKKADAEGGPPKKKPAGGEGEGDPAQMAMDQVMAAQMSQPQGPSPIDMAVAEQMQSIQGQMQALTQMQQMVQTIQARAQMIAGGGGAAAAPAAAGAAMGGPMDPSMMGAGAPVQGMPGGQPPMDPAMAGGAPPPQGGMPPGGAPPPQGQPGMAMQQGGGPQAAMGGMQPGMDPTAQMQQEPPPPAMMNADDGSVDSMMQQVNPQFMEQAGQLNDAGAFDAAALASMSQSPSLKDMVSSYMPNMEKSLDNIGRVLLTLWMDETHIKTDIGNETFISLEDNLRTTFKGLGDLILKINQNSMVLGSPNDSSYQE